MKFAVAAAALAALSLTACSEAEDAQAPSTPAPAPAPAAPALPDLPMTAAKAVVMMKGLPLACQQVATMRFDQSRCEETLGRRLEAGMDGKPVGDEAFRQEMADYRASLDGMSEEQQRTACATRYAALERLPFPRACFAR